MRWSHQNHQISKESKSNNFQELNPNFKKNGQRTKWLAWRKCNHQILGGALVGFLQLFNMDINDYGVSVFRESPPELLMKIPTSSVHPRNFARGYVNMLHGMEYRPTFTRNLRYLCHLCEKIFQSHGSSEFWSRVLLNLMRTCFLCFDKHSSGK